MKLTDEQIKGNPLRVTLDGVPVENQYEGVREFLRQSAAPLPKHGWHHGGETPTSADKPAPKAKLKERKPNALVQPVKESVKLNQTQMKSCGLGGWTGPREREPNEALPPQINKMKGKYTPPVWSVRPGAADHLEIRSRGL